MRDANIREILTRLEQLERRARVVAAQSDPDGAAVMLGFCADVEACLEELKDLPMDTPGMLPLHNFWLTLERCAKCFRTMSPDDPVAAAELRDALADARHLADVTRPQLDEIAIPE